MKNIDLGKYDLNKLLRNPGLIHKIQDNLCALTDDSIRAKAIRDGAITDINECIRMVFSQYHDNPQVIKRIVGTDTLSLIEEFSGITLANDLDNIFN